MIKAARCRTGLDNLSGMRFFEHRFPINLSSMRRWRRRVGESGAEELLAETIQTGLRLSVIRHVHVRRVNVDTTVQEKHVRFSTDARLRNRMRERLVGLKGFSLTSR